MGAVAAFNFGLWVQRYPEFASVSPELAQAYFDEATLYQRNDGTGPVCNPTQQLMLLNMLTAHIAKINAAIAGQPASDAVGRISQAGEGSVNVTTEYADVTPGSMAWFIQTKYGATWWQATAAYRMAKYSPGPIYQPWPSGPWGPGYGGPGLY